MRSIDPDDSRNQALLDAAPEAIVVATTAGRVITVNAAAERLTGWSRDELAGRQVWDTLFIPSCHDQLRRALHRLENATDGRRAEFPLRRRDGSHVAVEAAFGEIDAGCSEIVIAFLRDVSERRRAQRLQQMEHAVARVLATARLGDDVATPVLDVLGPALRLSTAELWLRAPDGGTLERCARWSAPERREAGATLRLPMVVAGEHLGRLEVVNGRTGGLRAEEVRAVDAIAGMLAQVYARRRAETELEEETEALAAVARVTRRLAAGADAEQGRRWICEAAREATGASIAYLAEPDPEGVGLVVRSLVGPGSPEAAGFLLPYDEPTATVRAYAANEPTFVGDFAAYDSAMTEKGAEVGAGACFVHPVRRGGQTVGVLGLVWPERRERVAQRLRTVVRLLADEAALAMSRADRFTDLLEAARTDALTGLPNRRAWEADLDRALANAHRQNGCVTVILLDLDGLKRLNDGQGHRAGDMLLKAAASAWQRVTRGGDVLARYGGDEFALLAHDCRVGAGTEMAERLRGALTDGTASFGVAEWDGEESGESLVQRADEALYAAKAAGRDRVHGAGA